MKISSVLLFTLLVALSSLHQKVSNIRPILINLAEAFSHQLKVPLSQFVSEIYYVPLESNPDFLVSGSAHIEVTDEFVIVRQRGSSQKYQILLFERNSGKFLREIGRNGRGPGEYSIYAGIPYNPVKREFYAISPLKEILVYDLSGKNIDKIKLPEFKDPKAKDVLSASTEVTFENMIDNSVFVGYIPNLTGSERKKLVLFSKDGFLKIFPNYNVWDRGELKGILLPPTGKFVNFYKWNNTLNFLEIFSDTLYQVTKESLLPRYHFDSGKFQLEYSKQGNLARGLKVRDFFLITDIDENKNFVFIQLFYGMKMYTGFIDKRDNTIKFCNPQTSDNSGLIDDISGLMEVAPRDFTQNNEMVWVIQPFSLLNWLKQNPAKAEKAYSNLPWLKGIDETSNPIIAIGKCK